ncbi:MAG TPA: aminotransferase class I/II-fold pyridoxal phosphate-dependent enzyme [Chloroflexota bacterium]|nr:aminotransferase class I/II-fold pyridoxal phosphate-dependent enzyme [Chloroflexota bacterium]
MHQRVAARTRGFTESVIREMTRLVLLHHPTDGVNLAQGFPDFAAPEELKEAAQAAIRADVNQYAITWGAKSFRDGISAKSRRFLGIDVDPETEITVTCGATEAMIATMLALLDPGDEVVIFEPFYENYGPDCILSAAVPRFVPLRPPDWSFDPAQLAAAFGEKTRAIVINTPNNPTGKVFSRDELTLIGALCSQHDCLIITDEIYEHMTYDGWTHVSPISLPGLRERTVVINALSKTFSVTGWRVGYVIAPPDLTGAIRKVHDFLTVGAAAPLQEAGAVAMQMPDGYYVQLRSEYEERRDLLVAILDQVGLRPFVPHGAYYAMCDISGFGFSDDVAFARHLVEELGVAVVPGSSFYREAGMGSQLVRFAFPKRLETLRRAGELLSALRPSARTRSSPSAAGGG